MLRGSHVYMDGTPRQVFRRADDLEDVGLDVPQATKIALALRRMSGISEASEFCDKGEKSRIAFSCSGERTLAGADRQCGE